VILLSISSFRSFALIDLLTDGGPGGATTVMSYYIYEQGLQLFEMGYASALAVVLFVAVLGLTLAQFAVRRRWVDEGE
jgi:multiple sugar transport system permease protein